MTKNKAIGSKSKIIFEKLTVEEEKKVYGSANPDGICGPELDACGTGSPPSLMDC